MLTITLLLPLAITTTNGMMRRMGGRNWQLPHRAINAVGIFEVLHFWWMVNLDTTLPKIYAMMLLLGMRQAWRTQASNCRPSCRLT